MCRDTIAAIATPPGIGGVGVIRISGSRAPRIAEAILGRLPAPRLATYGPFREADGDPIDEGIALFFPAPRSFTGEDVLELQGHGGPVVLDLLLRRCLEAGARLARPGEFSERAFLNGKLDLAQAEAIADLIEGSTALAVRLAGRSLRGELSRRVEHLIERLTRLRTYLEATLDFPDEEIDGLADTAVSSDLEGLLDAVGAVLRDAQQGEIVREGLSVVIAGAPNAGKSSLLNALSGDDTAIVTPIAGTTRDLLKIDIQLDGLPIRVADTAGMRESDDPVEREGVKRARDAAAQADLVLWVYDAETGLDPEPSPALPASAGLLRIRNKIDRIGESARVTCGSTGDDEVALSATTREGLDLLRERIKARAGLAPDQQGTFIARRRHVDALTRGQCHLEAAMRTLSARAGAELVAEELFLAQQVFGEITGEVTPDDLLGRIFSSFCIGK